MGKYKTLEEKFGKPKYQPKYTLKCEKCGYSISDDEYEEQRGVCNDCLYGEAH